MKTRSRPFRCPCGDPACGNREVDLRTPDPEALDRLVTEIAMAMLAAKGMAGPIAEA